MPETPTFLNTHAANLYRKIADRTTRIGIVGMGYVGLPLAAEFGKAGFTVIGIDSNERKCKAINAGVSMIQDVESAAVAALIESGNLVAVSSFEAAEDLDVIVICVPTPLSKGKEPDLSYVIAAARAASNVLSPGMLVILESTTYPGTTEDVVRPILEETGLVCGRDFFLAFSPERVDPGNDIWRTKNVPKIVGGLTQDCTSLAVALYTGPVDRAVPVSSPRTAEMVKLLENTFRAINIGLVNELALICDRIGISIWEVIDAAATKPFGFMPFYPGPGLGGHCIPVDPYYLSWKSREVGFEARFIELAGQVNAAMPRYVVDKISEALNAHRKAVKDSKILMIGVAYKRNVDDVRESPALDVIALLLKRGARVTYHDPFVARIDGSSATGLKGMDSVPITPELIAATDCVVILTDHTGIDYNSISSQAKLVVDTRNAVDMHTAKVFKLGAPYDR